MKKKSFFVLFSLFFALFSITAYSSNFLLAAFFMPTNSSCPGADDIVRPTFCSTMKISAICHCSEKLPKGLCQNPKDIYKRMIDYFGGLEAACEYQKEVPTQTCIDDWNCYMSGGKDKRGRLCSGTGKACPA